MLTLKLITEETDRVISGLEKKHFAGAKEAIDNVLAIDKRRREAQQKLDKTKQEAKQFAAQIGALMKQGKKDEAEQAKQLVAELKAQDKQLQEIMDAAEKELTTLLCQIPNIPYDEVPQGKAAEDNHVVKSNLKECNGNDTVGNWTVNPENSEAKLPHWELAKKYNLIDFDLEALLEDDLDQCLVRISVNEELDLVSVLEVLCGGSADGVHCLLCYERLDKNIVLLHCVHSPILAIADLV